YRRKRGLVEEINRSLQSVEDDAAAQNALGRRRWVDPGPVEYGPSQIESPEDGHGTGQSRPQPDAPPAARPPGKAPAPLRPAPKAEPKTEPRWETAPPPSAPSDDKWSRASPRGKASATQVASNPADRAAEGLPNKPPSKGKKSVGKLASKP